MPASAEFHSISNLGTLVMDTGYVGAMGLLDMLPFKAGCITEGLLTSFQGQLLLIRMIPYFSAVATQLKTGNPLGAYAAAEAAVESLLTDLPEIAVEVGLPCIAELKVGGFSKEAVRGFVSVTSILSRIWTTLEDRFVDFLQSADPVVVVSFDFTPDPPPVVNRQNCDQIRDTGSQSLGEALWFAENCQSQSGGQPSPPTNTPTATRSIGPAISSPTATVTPRPVIVSPTATGTATPVPANVDVWTDKAVYNVGDNITVCYSTSRAGFVILTVASPAGAQQDLVSQQRGPGQTCNSGTVNAPPRTDTLTLTLSEGPTLLASDTATYQIVQSGQPPVAPSNLSADPEVEGNRIFLDWFDNSNNETGFDIWDGVATVQVPANTEDYVFTGPPETYKCFAVRAFNSYGASAWTAQACATTGGGSPPPPNGSCTRAPSLPTNFTLNTATRQLSWQVLDPGGAGCVLTYRVATFGGQEIYRGSTPSVILPTINCNSGYFVGAANQNFGFNSYALWPCPNP
jgi:hypothetical protein